MTDLLKDLNKDQKKAVECIEKPVFVMAGPGTGKTRVTTHKLAYLIKEKGYSPGEIILLTFSDRAAKEMEDRVEDMIPDVTGVQISTFHSFCYDIIRDNSLELGINAGGAIITDEFQQAFLLSNLDSLGIESFKIPAKPIELTKIFQGAIARFKQGNITIERLDEYIKKNEDEQSQDEELPKLKDFAKAYRAYEDFKKQKGLLDFGDMQFHALDLFEKRPEILERYRQKFRHIIVDEFQDTDFIQLQILFQLAPEGNLTIVADDDQSIYRFRGAYLTNIQEFKEFYNDKGMPPEKIVLRRNYRCTGNIQKVAGNLIGNNPEREEKTFVTEKDEGLPVDITLYQDDWEQAKGIVGLIQCLHDQGRDWDDIAVLFRRRKDSIPIIEMLEKSGIQYEIIGSREYFREPIVRTVLAYLRVLNDPSWNQPALGQLLMRPEHGITPGEIPRLSRYARDKNLSLWEALGDLEEFDGDISNFKRFRIDMEKLFRIKGEQGLPGLVRAILFGKGLFRVEIAKNNIDNIRLLNRFLEITSDFLEVYPEASLEDFMMHIEALSNLGFEDKSMETDSGKVRLMTVHGSKGKELPIVIIPCLNKNRFPSTYQRYKIEIPDELADGTLPEGGGKELHEQEERRLFYVALTRGKDEVHVSYCRMYGNNKKETPPSIFLKEVFQKEEGYVVKEVKEQELKIRERSGSEEGAIFKRIISAIQRGEWQGSFDAMTALAKYKGVDLSDIRIPKELNLSNYLEELDVIRKVPEKEHAEARSYSPSKLSMYEECPRKYWYSHVLKIPGEVKTYFTLGSVVHNVIELITKRLKNGDRVSEDEALKILDMQWKSSEYEMESKEKQDRADAEEMIRKFMLHQAEKESRIVDVERWIKLDIEGRKIVGKVDRIDDVGNTLEVIDYKSSKNKTSKPKLKEDYQMALYWLGVESDYKKPVSRVGHWYLRMDDERMVELTEEERDAVRIRALKVIEGIEKGKFEPEKGYHCKRCDYGELCDVKK